MANRSTYTEHNGPKRGKGIGRKAHVKKSSRKQRRNADRIAAHG